MAHLETNSAKYEKYLIDRHMQKKMSLIKTGTLRGDYNFESDG